MAETSVPAQTPKKTVVKETPNNPQSVPSAKPTPKNEFLKTCFQDIVQRKTLHLNAKGISDILFYDLNIDFRHLSIMMKYVISESLVNYMKVWPGWDEFRSKGPESHEEYFQKFKEYLNYKIHFIIENEKLFYDDEEKNKKKVASVDTQTENPSKHNKTDAPYSLVICGQPNILNNIVFIEVDNNVVIKKHNEKAWKQTIPSEFLNYPFVHVSVNLPNVKLTRSNIHEYKRYITECGDTASTPEVDFISYIVKNDPQATTQVYSYEYMSAYFSQFYKVFHKLGAKVLPHLQVLFNEFLKDIRDSCTEKTKTMASPYTVCYNIGRKSYIRNKKMVVNSQKNKESNALNYCEILIPKLAFTLTEFNVEEDVMTPDVTFTDLNRIASMSAAEVQAVVQQVNTCITYQCLLCPKTFQGENAFSDISDHFRFLHKGEQAVLCFLCRRQFEVYTLAGRRWGHECASLSREGASPSARSVGNASATASTANSAVSRQGPPTTTNGESVGAEKAATGRKTDSVAAPQAGLLRNHLKTFVDPRTTARTGNESSTGSTVSTTAATSTSSIQ